MTAVVAHGALGSLWVGMYFGVPGTGLTAAAPRPVQSSRRLDAAADSLADSPVDSQEATWGLERHVGRLWTWGRRS